VKILFRVDAGSNVGLGHLIRSIAIARKLKENYNETEICFLTKDNKFSTDLLSQNEFKYILQEKESEETFITNTVKNVLADVLFIDRLYSYQPEFISKIQKHTRVCMFHNLCDGAFECDQFILPASHFSDKVLQDKRWMTGKVKFYEGFPFIVLNDKILALKRKSNINTDPMHIVLTTGGSDHKGIMIKLLEYLADFNEIENIKITALIGEIFSHHGELEKLRDRLSSIISVHPFNYSDLAKADLAINTFGVSTYELIYLGIPVISVGHSQHNAQGSAHLAEKYGIIADLGLIDDLTRMKFLSVLTEMIANPKQLMKIQKKSCHLIDGLGCARVADLIYSLGSA
jgi:spore coat polysaccharide biosynthesis predicted glycosyltransferase SpsG